MGATETDGHAFSTVSAQTPPSSSVVGEEPCPAAGCGRHLDCCARTGTPGADGGAVRPSAVLNSSATLWAVYRRPEVLHQLGRPGRKVAQRQRPRVDRRSAAATQTWFYILRMAVCLWGGVDAGGRTLWCGSTMATRKLEGNCRLVGPRGRAGIIANRAAESALFKTVVTGRVLQSDATQVYWPMIPQAQHS
jgi:hypothetical protein